MIISQYELTGKGMRPRSKKLFAGLQYYQEK